MDVISSPSLAQADPAGTVVRHLTATLAYRAAKVLRDAPAEFAQAAFGSTTRRPVQILAHMADLMRWGVTMTQGETVWKAAGSDDWGAEVDRFFDGLVALDRELAARPVSSSMLREIIQGPLADALTHVGQLALLRGMAGAPVRPENYARADIAVGRVNLDQPPPGREFDGDASRR